MPRQKNKKINLYVALGLMMTPAVISGMILSASFASADDSVVDTITAIVPVSCTMSGSGMTSHSANVSSGTYTQDIGTTTIDIVCNDSAGFSVYASGFTGNAVGETYSNKLIGTAASGNATIDTGTATGPGSTDISNWAMKLETDSYAAYPITILDDYDYYHAVPSNYKKVATRLTGTDAGADATGTSFTSTYAAYFSKSQPADTYTGQVKYVLVHPNTEPAPVQTSCATPVPNVTYMQELAAMTENQRQAILSSMTEDEQYHLKDNRDNKSYCVAKLRDGNLWMTQNLDHDIKNDGSVTYDNTTTDIGYNTVTGQYDVSSWQPDEPTYTSDVTEYYGFNLVPVGDSFHAGSYDVGDLYWDGVVGEGVSSSGNSHYHLGNYYNWSAAVAMNDTSSLTTGGELVEQSICPAGWTLPRVGTGDDTFKALWDEYGFTNLSYKDTNGNGSYDDGEDAVWTDPLFFSLNSDYLEEGFSGVGTNAGLWSPVVYWRIHMLDYENYAGIAYFYRYGALYPSDYRARYYFIPVRCVARPVSTTVSGLSPTN